MEEELEDLDLPNRLIAHGEEPLGERVNVYHKMKTLSNIFDALDDDEKSFIRCTQFGKLLEFKQQPAWSASFGILLLSRQLEIAKSKEIWVVFAGTPVRFSLREFKLVTGLLCGRYPNVQKKRKKNTAGKKIPFYSKLFGLEEDVTVERVITMLKKKIVTDPDTRQRYACLAIVDGYLLPTSHYPKIVKEHAEMSEDISSFISYPWGRLSFDMMMTSIKERDVEQLATTCVAVQGLLYALQLVILWAAPSIQDGATSDGSVGSDSEEESSPGTILSRGVPFKLGHAKEIDEQCKAQVDPIICPAVDTHMISEDLTWSDEEEDPRVDNIVRLAKDGFKFTNDMFQGGCFPAELEIAPKKQKRAARGKAVRTRKTLKGGRNPSTSKPTANREDEASAPRYVDINSISRMLDVKMAAQEKRIVEAVVSWFEKNTGGPLGKGSISKDTGEINLNNGKSNGEQPSDGQDGNHGAATNGNGDNFNVLMFRDGQDGIDEFVGSVSAFYAEDGTTHRTSSSPTPLPKVPLHVEDSQEYRVEDMANLAKDIGKGAVGGSPSSGHVFPVDNMGRRTSELVHDCLVQGVPPKESDAGPPKNVSCEEHVGGESTDQSVPAMETEADPHENASIAEQVNVMDVDSVNNPLPSVPDMETEVDSSEIVSFAEQENVMNVDSVNIASDTNQQAGLSRVDEGSAGDAHVDPINPLTVVGETIPPPPEEDVEGIELMHPPKPSPPAAPEARRSKRTRTISTKLDARYQIPKKTKATVGHASPAPSRYDPEKRFQNSMKKLKAKSSLCIGGEVILGYKDVIDLIERKKPMTTKVMDALIKFSRHLLRSDEVDGGKLRVDVLDSKFVGGLNRLYSKFLKSTNPETFKFPSDLIDAIVGGGDPDRIQLFSQADYVYMPFNFGKTHWVALCVDFQCARILVLDSNFRLRTDFTLRNDIKPIAVMLPYLIKQGAVTPSMSRMLPIEFTIERSLSIPQVASNMDSGIMSIFLIHAHATGGLEECFDFDVSSLDVEAKKLVSAIVMASTV